MYYSVMTESDVKTIAELYMDYYNTNENGCWTSEKANKRIRQIVTIEDSLCLIQRDDAADCSHRQAPIRESAARVNAVFDSWSDAFGALKEDIRAPDGKNKDVL